MRHPLRRSLAALALAMTVVGCGAAPGPTPAQRPTEDSVAPTVSPISTSPTSPTTPTSTAVVAGTDTGAPPRDSGKEPRPGLNGVPDPATLSIPEGPWTKPNLGDPHALQPTASLSALPASPDMGAKFAGVKALLIQRKFGLARAPGEPYRKEELNAAVVAKIRSFQSAAGLKASGTVDRATWQAMFPDLPFDLDHWRTSPQLGIDAPPQARIEQMITFARGQIGAPYLWGGAGPKQYGYDCSGLILQAMHSAGLDPAPINVVDHQRPDYPTSKKLYNYPGFKHLPVARAQRGDLVFYGRADNPASVTHVALVLGNGFVLQSVTAGVDEDPFVTGWGDGLYTIRPDAVRLVG